MGRVRAEEQDIAWYDWQDGVESLETCKARRLRQVPRLTPPQLEVLHQTRKTVWDGYVISKIARDELRDLGLITRCQGWQVITREGLAVLDVYGLLKEDRWGTTYDRGGALISRETWGRLRTEGFIV